MTHDETTELRHYALIGAREQLTRICAAFPELMEELRVMSSLGVGNNGHGGPSGPTGAAKGGRKPMTAAQRAAISKKMKRAWKARKAAAGKG
jgi:hypothetical protein